MATVNNIEKQRKMISVGQYHGLTTQGTGKEEECGDPGRKLGGAARVIWGVV